MASAKPKVFKEAEKQRLGKGFSRGELKKAGLSLKEALKFGIPLDSRRKTLHEDNVEAVRVFVREKKAASKPKKAKGKSKS